MPRTATTPCRPSGSTPTYAARKQCPEKKTVSSLLVNDDRPYPTSDMGIEHSEESRSLLRADPEVGEPATKIFIQPLETSLERLSPTSRSQLPDSEFQPIDCPLGQMHLHLAVRISFKAKPQKMPQAVRAIPVPDKTFEAPCPEQCPCGGKVGAEGSIDLYQVDIPPIQPETWKFVVGHGHCQKCGRRVRGQHPLLISKAFEVGTVHFGPRLLAFAAFQKMICGVSYDKIRLGFEQMLGFPVARSTLCRAMQRLARRAKPTRDALVEALRASPVVYADETGWKQGGRRVWLWVFTNLRETVYEILPGRGFEQAASVLGKNYAGTLGVDGWAPYRCFKEATLQTCYNHLLHRCHELLETATRGAVRFPRLVKAILRHALFWTGHSTLVFVDQKAKMTF